MIGLESIDKAIDGFIRKEIETLMRGSHIEQIEFLDDKLKLGLKEHFPPLSEFLELAERRNLFVHTGGKVSQQYLDNCRKFGCAIAKTLSLNELLSVDAAYYHRMYTVCFELGLRIAQSAFRRIYPEKLESADKALNHLAVRFLGSEDWALAESITSFNIEIPQKLRAKGEYYYFAMINCAIARKFAGKEFEAELAGVDWLAFHPKYSLALAVLRGDFALAEKIMNTDVVKNAVGENGFRTWPLFRDFRKTEFFFEGLQGPF